MGENSTDTIVLSQNIGKVSLIIRSFEYKDIDELPEVGAILDLLQLQQQNQIYFFKSNGELSLIAPILSGILYRTKQEAIEGYGTHKDILLHQLARIFKDHPGMYGICFEYAVHEAILRGNPSVLSRIQYALKICNILGCQTTSIHLGFEKSNILQIVEKAKERLTYDSMLVYDETKAPIRLLLEIDKIEKSFRSAKERSKLELYISDIWKADLFIGNMDSDMWIAASVKVLPSNFSYYKGLRMEIIAGGWKQERHPVYKHKNGMVYCFLPYDGNFVLHFHTTWNLVKLFLEYDAKVPKERNLPMPKDRAMASYLESRREEKVVDIIDELNHISQSDIILPIFPKTKSIILNTDNEPERIILAPEARLVHK